MRRRQYLAEVMFIMLGGLAAGIIPAEAAGARDGGHAAARTVALAGSGGMAMALGGLALPGTAASAAVTGGPHSRFALSAEAMLAGVAVVSAQNAWAVGAGLKNTTFEFTTPFLAHWDGRAWTQVTSGALPRHGYLRGITTFKGGAWAVGASGTHPHGTPGHHFPLIMRLKGGTWTRVAYPNKGGGHLTAVAASSPSNAWAVGSVVDAAGDGPQLIVHWNGRAWKQVRVPILPASGFLLGVATTSPRSAWAVGNTDPGAIFIIHWDGKRWRQVRSPGMTGTNRTLVGVTATSTRNAWAVGSDWGRGKTLILHWNGRTWKRVPSPSPGGGPNTGLNLGPDNRLGGIAASSAASAWAVGWGSSRGLEYAPLILHWNGHKWKHVTAPDPPRGGFLEGIGIGPSGHAWAVGYTDHLLSLFLHWNGRAWH